MFNAVLKAGSTVFALLNCRFLGWYLGVAMSGRTDPRFRQRIWTHSGYDRRMRCTSADIYCQCSFGGDMTL